MTDVQRVGGAVLFQGDALTDLAKCVLAKIRELQSHGYSRPRMPSCWRWFTTLGCREHDTIAGSLSLRHTQKARAVPTGSVSPKPPRYSDGMPAGFSG